MNFSRKFRQMKLMQTKSSKINQRFLFFVTGIYPETGGIQRYNHIFAKSLADGFGKNNLKVINLKIGEDSKKEVLSNEPYALETKYIPIKRGLFYKPSNFIHIIREFIKPISEFKPDIVISGHISLLPFIFIVSLFNHYKYIQISHGIEVWAINSFILKRALRRAFLNIAVSQFTSNQLQGKEVSKEKIKIIHNSVDTDFFRSIPKNIKLAKKIGVENKKILLTVGRIDAKEQYKGHDIILKLLPDIKKEISNISYIIVGNGTDRKRLEQLANDLEIKNDVIFAGNITESELLDYYNLCDLYIMPSKTIISSNKAAGEGFGIVFLEAAACEKPVIAGESGGCSEAVIDNVTGYLVDPNKEIDIRNKIINILKNNRLKNKMGKMGRNFVMNNFSSKRIENDIYDLFQNFETR